MSDATPEIIQTLRNVREEFRLKHDTEPEVLLVPFAFRDEVVRWSVQNRRFVNSTITAGRKGIEFDGINLIATNSVAVPTPAEIVIRPIV